MPAGAVGYNSGAASDVYWDEGATAATLGVGYDSNPAADSLTGIGGSTGRNPYAQATYAGFDFTTVWTIQPGATRPYLVSTPQSPPPS